MRKYRLLTILVSLLIGLPAMGLADVVIGYLSFDLLIPGDVGSPGVNGFDIGNLTGDPLAGGFATPPTFPVLTGLTFTNSSISLTSGGNTQSYLLGDLGPGVYLPAALQFPDTATFSSALFTAKLDTTTFELAGGGTFTASSALVSAELLPSSGDVLTAGTDIAFITVAEQAPPTVPEPSSFLVVMVVLAGMLLKMRPATSNR